MEHRNTFAFLVFIKIFEFYFELFMPRGKLRKLVCTTLNAIFLNRFELMERSFMFAPNFLIFFVIDALNLLLVSCDII